MLQAALSDVWIGVLDDACAREIESTLNFSLRGSCLLERTKKFRVWVDSLKNDIFILNLHNIVNG